MNEEAAITTVRDVYASFARGDLEYVREALLADEVVFHVPGRGTLAGDYHGRDEVINYLAKVAEAGTVRMEPTAFLVGDGHIAAVIDVEGERDDRRLYERGMQLFRLTDGKIGERWSYPPESYAADEYFA